MINSLFKFFIFIFLISNYLTLAKSEEFKFDVTEIEISENGNLIIGSKNKVEKALSYLK